MNARMLEELVRALLVTADPAIHIGRVRSEGKSLQLIAALDNTGRAAELAASLALKFARRS